MPKRKYIITTFIVLYAIIFITGGTYIGGYWSFWQLSDGAASVRRVQPGGTPPVIPTTSPGPQQSPRPSGVAANIAGSAATLPEKIDWDVSFTSQAPHRNWIPPYKEFCEEASALMAASYFLKEPILNADDADGRMLAIRDFEEQRFGYSEDTGVEDTAVILREYFGLSHVKVIYDPSIIDIKQVLATGKLVIIPAAGRELGNPHYTPPGPVYHMLVIKGYAGNEFITNDPGTRLGADLRYNEKILWNAIHDWNIVDIKDGQRAMIIVG